MNGLEIKTILVSPYRKQRLKEIHLYVIVKQTDIAGFYEKLFKMLKRLLQAQNTETSSAKDKAPTPTEISRENTQTSKKGPQQAQAAPKMLFGQSGKGPSLLGLLAAKRFTRKLGNKYGRGSMYGSSRFSNSYAFQKEPSYRMEPHRRFNPEKVEEVIQETVDSRMKDFKYHPKFCANMCKSLGDEIKEKVKRLRYDRYKVVVVVHIGEKSNQSAVISSRCAWDQKLDDYATYTMETPTLFCTTCVYGIYTE